MLLAREGLEERLSVESEGKHGTYLLMTARPPEAHNYRDLDARLDREQERIRDENEWKRPDPLAEGFAKRTERELRESLGDTIPVNAVRVVLPSNADPLEPWDPSRRAQFTERLVEIVERAVRDRTRLPNEPLEPELPASGREILSAFVCTACRGSCCRSGGDHAYITEETIARTLHAHPDRTPAQIVDSYLKHLPAETYLNSCIYHSATGCGLPRALRSSTCNRHLCGKLQNLRATLPENNPPPSLAVMFDHGQWARTALIHEGGIKILSEEVSRDESR